jgi:hypothetical protein
MVSQRDLEQVGRCCDTMNRKQPGCHNAYYVGHRTDENQRFPIRRPGILQVLGRLRGSFPYLANRQDWSTFGGSAASCTQDIAHPGRPTLHRFRGRRSGGPREKSWARTPCTEAPFWRASTRQGRRNSGPYSGNYPDLEYGCPSGAAFPVQTWPQDPLKRVWLHRWCRTHLKATPGTDCNTIS